MAAFIALACGGCGDPLPASAIEILDHADSFEIFALDPAWPDDPKKTPDPETTLGGHKILARATISDAAAQHRIWKIVDDGTRGGNPHSAAGCFNPRHGVRARKGDTTVDLVICYECSSVEIISDKGTVYLQTKNVRSRLDVEFKAAGIEAPPDRH